MRDDDALTMLQRELEVFVLDDKTRSRIRGRFDAHCVREAAPPAAAPRRRSRNRYAWTGTALAGAATMLLVIALGPSINSGGDERDSSQPSGPRAALLSAATAAGRAPWRPLAPNEFHHVYSTTFFPKLDPVPGMEDRQMNSAFQPNPWATESWLRPDGRGVVVEISGGGGDPTRYPDFAPNSRGEISGYGGTLTNGFTPVSDVEASLRYPDAVRTWSWLPTAERPNEQLWVRARSGFVAGISWDGTGLPIPSLSVAERNMVRHWGDTYDNVAALDELHGEELDSALLRLLDGNPRKALNESPEEGTTGTFGLTPELIQKERRIRRAVQLLGTAPLAPQARQAMYEWLAEQDGAQVDVDATDELDRPGTRVTFERVYDEAIPARTVTLDDLRTTAVTWPDGPPPDDVKGAKPTYSVPAHRAQRRWYVSFVFDRRSGELLEQVQYTGHRTTKPIPQLEMSGYPPRDPFTWRVTTRQLFGIMTDSAVYLTRERATELQPDAAVCNDNPRVCR